jgi:sporulation protein YlmC with PRC-barrel domain
MVGLLSVHRATLASSARRHRDNSIPDRPGEGTVTTLEIGSGTRGSDGFRGEVRCVVIDPAAGTVTHLVVEPEGREGLARLVPLDIVDATTEEIRLDCTEEEFRNLPPAEQTLAEFVLGYDVPVQVLPPGWRDAGGPVVEGSTVPRIPEKETIDIVPPGEIEEGSGGRVHATDGDIGQLRGIRIDPGSRKITHLLLREGHLWGRKEVAIPFGEIAGLDDGIRLRITKQQVEDLPPADAREADG